MFVQKKVVLSTQESQSTWHINNVKSDMNGKENVSESLDVIHKLEIHKWLRDTKDIYIKCLPRKTEHK